MVETMDDRPTLNEEKQAADVDETMKLVVVWDYGWRAQSSSKRRRRRINAVDDCGVEDEGEGVTTEEYEEAATMEDQGQ